MAIFKCKMCGGTVEFTPGATVGECDSCGMKQTLPRLDDERRVNLYDRANHFRRANEYDKAMGIYETILAEDKTDAEAYWSLVLCRYGVEYVEDPASHKRVPTVNRAQYTSVLADEDYKSALQYADTLQKSIYEAEAKAIDDIQKGILEISQKEEPFDVFICYKETDANGRRTLDSVLATELYHELVKEGFKVFFSRITLEDKLGTAYEPYIFAALHSAKVMVVLGTKAEHFNAVWVKNEWSRYLALIQSGEKKTLIPAYKDMDPYDLPEAFSHLQAQDMAKLGFMQDLVRGIRKIVGTEEPKPVKETVVVQSAAPQNANVVALKKRGFMALEDGEWDRADGFFEEALNQDAEDAECYLGKLMAQLHVHLFEELSKVDTVISEDNLYRRAILFAGPKLKETLQSYSTIIDRRIVEKKEQDQERLYNAAMQAMETATTIRQYSAVAQAFSDLGDFRDALQQSKLCVQRITEILKKRKGLLPVIGVGDTHTIALNKNGTVNATKHSDFLYKGQCAVNGWRDIVAVAANNDYSIGLRRDGTVITTKYIGDKKYYYGECDVDGWEDIIAVAAGAQQAIGLRANGTIVVTKGPSLEDPIDASGMEDLEDIASGDYHIIGLQKNGTVVASGSNNYGQCDVSEWTDIVSVFAGSFFSFGLKADGTVITTAPGDEWDNMLHEVSEWTGIVAIAAGYYYVIGLREDGTVAATQFIGGEELYNGQCDVENWTDIVAIAACDSHVVGLRADGTLLATGNNEDGACEVSSMMDIKTPKETIETMRIKLQRKKDYWREHAEERAGLEDERVNLERENRSIVIQLEQLNNNQSPTNLTIQQNLMQITDWISQRDKLFFNGKKKKELQDKIDAAKAEIDAKKNEISQMINSLKQKQTLNQTRIREIDATLRADR